jgi:fused signal recognition particle receptor
MNLWGRLRDSLRKTREAFAGIRALARSGRPLDASFWSDLEDHLIAADVGVAVAGRIVADLRTVAGLEGWSRADQALERLRRDLERFLDLPGAALRLERRPSVVLIVGVNGSGKTTTVGKLAHRLRAEGRSVILVAADTFRAAATEQLAMWAERTGAALVKGTPGADPAAVVHDGMQAALARGSDVVLIDTAGRLQTKTNLMEELKKVRRVVERVGGAPPDATLLVLDGTSGENALSQARAFHAATPLDGVIVTKLDSSAKGGALLAVVEELEVPILFAGTGESADALEPFSARDFIAALFDDAPALVGNEP